MTRSLTSSPSGATMLYWPCMKRFNKIFAVFLTLVLVGQGCTKGPTPEAQQLSKPTTLNVWSVVDDIDVYQPILNDFRAAFPNVEIRFRRFRLEEYENEILNALSEDKGPDVFLIHNTWVGKYLPKIQPSPPSVRVAQQVVTGTVRKQVVYEVVEAKTISPRQYRQDFVDAVAKDGIRRVNVSTLADQPKFEDRVVAIPMSVDTLALYYNKDLLNTAGIATPPDGWDQFQAQVRRLVRQNALGEIVQAGAGFGTGSNVERSPDIMALLMMQNGTVMADDNGYPTFERIPPDLASERDTPPAFEALGFYTDFANPSKDVYSWNLSMPNSLDAFIQGSSAFFLGYSYHLPVIRARAPKINLGITKVPQITGNPEVNFANYWMWTVSKKAKNADLAWHFVNFLTNATEAPKYLEAAKRPAARRALLTSQLEDEDIGVFSSQVLTAKSWYRGVDPKNAELAIIDMIDGVVQGTLDPRNALRLTSEKIAQTIQAPRTQ